ncbi:hypothetical protein ACW5R3_09160 [Bizionia sp. KMM 8389]
MKNLTYLSISLLFVCLFLVNPISATNNDQALAFNQPQLVRIDFTTPQGYVRQILLGFTPDNAASDGVDYGYDAINAQNLPDDLNWMINDQRYIIQGVGAFDSSKVYPLGMFLSNSGDVKIELNNLQYFDSPIDVYLYDAENNTHTLLNETDFELTMNEGDYLERFFITFSSPLTIQGIGTADESLSVDETSLNETSISYLRNSKTLLCKSNQTITHIEIYNILGKRIEYIGNINKRDFSMPIPSSKERYGILRIYTTEGLTSKKIIF